ncbi:MULTISPECIES: DUF4397 domain-containing protein [Bacillaceae]|uniref:DUF4397 domain-containing protein n=1 Tax=Bacillaceae TaxID=186817 RepID=UPI001E4AD4D8|nr:MULTISPECIES: DUF4397 domain-containing protein [Bacillaceae]MCE4047321.1 DUF4397 domain-containing protein [Bacillus sp. Au-Bac7]MCM3030599.1 DUF4397 domain-containing protein [Niallia sp. MER 6]MDL0437120.1 DUF4397 domain-containing protein [Niallia sp. SS-2023]UPO86319.1 DUF4397 domain-containing protein [Niallia sp. Man26]
MNKQGDSFPIHEAGMYNLLSDYYKYTNPELHIYYYQKHLQSLKMALPQNITADTERQAEYGKIRFIHASVQKPAVDIFINGVKIFKEVPFKSTTNDMTLPVGRYQIDIYETGKMVDSLCSQKILVESNIYHTITFLESANQYLKLYSYREDPFVHAAETKLRFIHLHPKLPALNIAVQKGDVVFPGLHLKASTSYLGLYPMTVYLEARDADTNRQIATLPPLTLKENKAYSALILEGSSEEAPTDILLISI